MNSYKLIIFDWDGTVMDSVPKIVNCMQQSAKALTLPVPSSDAVKNIIGMSLEKAIAVLFESNHDLHADLVLQYKHQYKEVDNTPALLFDGVIDTLRVLKEQGKILVVATGKSREGLERLLDETNLRYYFSATRTSDDALSKPAPDMLEQLVKEFAIEAHQAVMVGDTKIDMTMAQAAGIDRIGVTMGAHNANQLKEHEPIAVIDSFSQLQSILGASTS